MLFATLTLAMAAVGQGPADWYEPFPAHKIIGNTYYVGSKDLATYSRGYRPLLSPCKR
jgi:metallo-beta-lactamase class B